ncbi:MAG: hypothetical protein ACKV19_13560 [Verrucomicrobiales bacterium]
MPEMTAYCGQRFRVLRRAEKTCVEGSPDGIRQFPHHDVVFLENLRCQGSSHDGCGRACLFFWKEAWLLLVGPDYASSAPMDEAELKRQGEALTAKLPTRHADGRYCCQSSELPAATASLSAWGRLETCVRDVRHGTYSISTMVLLILRPLWSKIKHNFVSRYPSTSATQTPTESLGLQPGEWVQVRSLEEIQRTLDTHARNRGLQFSYDLAPQCGRVFRVRSRLDRIIVEGTGKMATMKNTVLLEGALCPCQQVVGGCPRLDHIYWREIWLRRVPAPLTTPAPARK